MNNRFDELTKGLAQSVTRRQALKKFGAGIAGMALACFGMTSKAAVRTRRGYCQVLSPSWFGNAYYNGICIDVHRCITATSADCPTGTPVGDGRQGKLACGSRVVDTSKPCSFTI